MISLWTTLAQGRIRQLVLLLVLLFIGALARPAAAATCGVATGQGTAPADYSTYCWFDFSTYNDTTARSAGGQNFSFSLPGGATISFNVKASGTGITPVASPSWTGSAFGNTAFLGIPGRPVLYGTGTGASNLSFTNIVLAVGASSNIPYTFVAADGESTNVGESVSFTTNGNPWSVLAQMSNGGAIYPTLTGVGTGTVTETGVNGTVGSYAFSSTGNPTSVGSTFVNGGLEGVIFGVKFLAADLTLTKSHTGNFVAGTPGSYNLLVHNNGPDGAAGTTTVTDTLPTGLSYVSASGTGWTCTVSGQIVTCTSTSTVASGANLPAITLNVNVAANAAASISNTASVSNPNYNYNTTNDSSTDVATVIQSDLSTSTKTVLDTNGGDTNPGDTLRYTITLTNSTAAAATGVSVLDNMPLNVGGLNVVSIPSGSTDSSTTSGGTNGTGKVNVTGITVPGNGSASIVYEVTVSAGVAAGTTIDNTATITNPNGVNANPVAPTVIVSQSQVAASGNKVLYVYANGTLSRTPQPGSSVVTVGEASNLNFVLSAVQKPLVLIPGHTISTSLLTYRTGSTTSTTRTVHVELYKNGTTLIGTSGPTSFTSTTPTLRVFNITAPAGAAGSLNTGDTLTLRVVNESSGSGTRSVGLDQLTSVVTFDTSTVINVDSVNFYSAAYPATTTKTSYGPGDTVYVRAVISDPFGSYDVDHATVSGTDPNGTVIATNVAMPQVADSGAATRTFEIAYTLPGGAAVGYWNASVTGYEGTEGTITHTATAAFNVGVPNLLVMKSVSVISDPVEGTTRPKSLPGAIMQYRITVSNNGVGPADNNSLVITDPVPANTKFVLASTVFTDGSPTSGLTLSAANVTYSNVGITGPWAYVPVNDGSGADANVKALRIAPQGAMAGKGVGAAPGFSVVFRVAIQ